MVRQDYGGRRHVHRCHTFVSWRGGHQFPVAFRQVARLCSDKEPRDERSFRDILGRRRAHRPLLQREPHACEVRGCESSLLESTHRHRGRAFLQASRHRPNRLLRRHQGHASRRRRPRSVHHNPAVGKEHVPRAHTIQHGIAGQHPWHTHAHNEEQGVDYRRQTGVPLQQGRDSHDVRQHRGLRRKFLWNKDRMQDILQHHPATDDHRTGGHSRGNVEGNDDIQPHFSPREQHRTTQCGARQHGETGRPHASAGRLHLKDSVATRREGGQSIRRTGDILPRGGGKASRGMVQLQRLRPIYQRSQDLHLHRHPSAEIRRGGCVQADEADTAEL